MTKQIIVFVEEEITSRPLHQMVFKNDALPNVGDHIFLKKKEIRYKVVSKTFNIDFDASEPIFDTVTLRVFQVVE